MNRLTMIAMFAVAVAAVGCGGKKDKDKAAKTNTATTPAAGSAATAPTTGAGSAATVTPPAGGTVTAPATGDTATPPAAGGAPAMSDAEFEATMGKAVVMFTAMGDATDKAAGDCGVLATSLEKVITDNQPFIDGLKKYKDNPDMDKKGEAWMTAHAAEIMGPMMKVQTAGQKCATDAKFMAVMEKLEDIGN